ncbi:hypothetical protein BURKHO8Y_170114 [Burkholderia sp. 8Y]|nr:hypothetical protein BURKHO8Y_170114 [Burkholderia sp. 8Y]
MPNDEGIKPYADSFLRRSIEFLRQLRAADLLAKTGDSSSFLALALGRRLFVGHARLQFLNQARAFDGTAKTSHGDVERLILFQQYFSH